MSDGPAKTNAARALDRLGIAYELRAYEVDPDDLRAESVAAKIGMPAAQVWKTLVVRGQRVGVFMAVIAGDMELDGKAVAAAMGDRKAEPVALKEVQPLTGYVRGGVTALAGKKTYPVIVDERALAFDRISVSAGTRGVQILIAPSDYVRATSAMLGRIARPKAGPAAG